MLDLEDAEKLLRTLAIPLRLRILLALRNRGWLGVPEIIAALGEGQVSPSNVYEHLQALVNDGLLQTKRQDRKVLYNVGPAIAAAVKTLETLAETIGKRGGLAREDAGGDGED